MKLTFKRIDISSDLAEPVAVFHDHQFGDYRITQLNAKSLKERIKNLKKENLDASEEESAMLFLHRHAGITAASFDSAVDVSLEKNPINS